MINKIQTIQTGSGAIIAWGKVKFVESKKIKNDTLSLTTFTLNQGKNPNWKEGEPKKDKDYFIKCKCFGEIADNLKYLTDGMRIVVFGEKQTESWKDKTTDENKFDDVILINIVTNCITFAVEEEQPEEVSEDNSIKDSLPF